MTPATKSVKLPSLTERIEWYEDWEEKTRKARERSRKCNRYVNNDQWTSAERAELKNRRQPVITKNYIARKVNYFCGEEIRKRVDPVARPRTPQESDNARAVTDGLRYAEEEEKFDQVRSAVFRDMIVCGYGGAMKSMMALPNGDYKHTLTHVQWDRLFWDPASRSLHYDDSLYMGEVLWLDLDVAIRSYPSAERELRAAVASANDSGDTATDDVPRETAWGDRNRKRVKIVEMYFRIGDDWYRSDFTRGADLPIPYGDGSEVEPGPQPTFILDELGYRHMCPLQMESCYVDDDGNRFGVVEYFISPQDEINKRASKALHLLSVDRTMAEEGVIDDPDKYRSERAKPDGFMEVAANAIFENRIRNESGSELAQGQFMLLQEAKNDIASVGPSASSIGELPGGISGRAFIARQQAASQELGSVFDQIREWSHRIFMLDWCCIRQFWTDEKWLRVTDDRELTGYRFTALNQQTTRAERFIEMLQKQPPLSPDKALEIAAGQWAPAILADAQAYVQQLAAQQQMLAQQQQAMPGMPQQQLHIPDIRELITQHPLMQEQVTVNQVAQMLIDIVIDEAPETAVLADEQFEKLGALMPAVVNARPDLAQTMARALIQASSLPDKREILQEFDKGRDPQAMQAQAQAQAQAQQLAKALQEARLAVDQTRAMLQQAQAQKTMAETQQTVAETQTMPAKLQDQASRTRSSVESSAVDNAIKVDNHRREMMPHVTIVAEGMPVT